MEAGIVVTILETVPEQAYSHRFSRDDLLATKKFLPCH